MLASLEMLEMVKMYPVTLMMRTNDLSRGESRKVMRLHEKMSCILQWGNQANSAEKRARREVAGCGRPAGTVPPA